MRSLAYGICQYLLVSDLEPCKLLLQTQISYGFKRYWSFFGRPLVPKGTLSSRPPATPPMFRSNFAAKVYLRTMGNWVGMEQFQGQIALLIPTKIDHQGRPRMTKSWIQPIWQFVKHKCNFKKLFFHKFSNWKSVLPQVLKYDNKKNCASTTFWIEKLWKHNFSNWKLVEAQNLNR